jgi:hypothetical protein
LLRGTKSQAFRWDFIRTWRGMKRKGRRIHQRPWCEAPSTGPTYRDPGILEPAAWARYFPTFGKIQMGKFWMLVIVDDWFARENVDKGGCNLRRSHGAAAIRTFEGSYLTLPYEVDRSYHETLALSFASIEVELQDFCIRYCNPRNRQCLIVNCMVLRKL